MKKYLIAGALIIGFSAPSWATETFYMAALALARS